MDTILVSACLLGTNCKYNGGNNKNDKVLDFIKDKRVILICPEIMGGLSTPRVQSERKDNLVINKEGEDVTKYFFKGAEETLYLAKLFNCKMALLKAKSPSCGYGLIYDGSFSSTLIDGNGVTTDLLLKNNINVITENDL